MEPTISYELKSTLADGKIPKVTRAKVDAAARAILAYPGGFSGRGITVCAGGFRYFTNAWVLIRMLRKLGCQLPVQFWYYGEAEMDEKMRRMVEPYGVQCVDARRVAKAVGCRLSQGWPLKPFSILHSPFEEVLALDADNFPIRDPEYLFESDGYRETGAIFWPDVGRTESERAIWDLMGVAYRNEPEFESGQILVNKAVCWEPLNLAMWMNESGRAEFFYKIIWGDKDTFRFAWHKFGFSFAMTPVPLQMLSVVGGPCCSGVMCQHDLDGERIFQHRNVFKWELFGENPWVPGFLFEGECRGFLGELRTVWNGRVGAKGNGKTARIARWERKLQESAWLLETDAPVQPTGAGTPFWEINPAIPAAPVRDGLSVAGKDPWPKSEERKWQEIRFMEGGHCGRWTDSRFTFWDLQEARGQIRLVVGGKDGTEKPTASFVLQADGSWRGVADEGKGKEKLRLLAVESVYPSVVTNDVRLSGRRGVKGKPEKNAKTLHVFNSAGGIGDHITALYACAGAANAGWTVVFYTRFPQWLSRVRHPGLTITGDIPKKFSNAINVKYDEAFLLRFGTDKARWYADAIQPGIAPARPAHVDVAMRMPRFDFDRYVVLAPFSAWARRDWPAANWTRLTHLLREAGYEVVAIGVAADEPRFAATFGETTALWALDHKPEWVMDAMLGAACVIGNDSGMVHLAGLLRVPTVALHAHLPGDFLFAHAKVASLVPKTNCALCRWQPERGYNTACDTACSALGTIGPEEVLRVVRRVGRRAGFSAKRAVLLPEEVDSERLAAIEQAVEKPRNFTEHIDPLVEEAAAVVGWDKILPFLTDALVAEYERMATRTERAQLDEWFGVAKVLNARPSKHVLATSLFWKHVDADAPDLPLPTLDLLRNAKQYGLVLRFDPWAHYVEPLLRGAAQLAGTRPDITVRVYLANDLEFLAPLLTEHCEVQLMRHSSLRHSPGAMWRFLAMEDVADLVSVIDADSLATDAERVIQMTENVGTGEVASWRQINGMEVDASGFFTYRPMMGCTLGSRRRLPMARLMKAFTWHFQRGLFPKTIFHPKRGELPHFQKPWPGYAVDEWFLATTVFPRLLAAGFISLGGGGSCIFPRDTALAAMTNSRSRPWV